MEEMCNSTESFHGTVPDEDDIIDFVTSSPLPFVEALAFYIYLYADSDTCIICADRRERVMDIATEM